MRYTFEKCDDARLKLVALKKISGVHEDVHEIDRLSERFLHYSVPPLINPVVQLAGRLVFAHGVLILESEGDALHVIGGIWRYRWARMLRNQMRYEIYMPALIVVPQKPVVRRAFALEEAMVHLADAGSLDDGKAGLVKRVVQLERATFPEVSRPRLAAAIARTSRRTAQRELAKLMDPPADPASPIASTEPEVAPP